MGRLVQEAGSSDAAVSQPARTHISQWWERKFRVIAVILKKASLRVAAAASAGAGWVHPQASLEPQGFAAFLTRLRSQEDVLRRAAAAALGHGKPDAAQRLADLTEQLAGKTKE